MYTYMKRFLRTDLYFAGEALVASPTVAVVRKDAPPSIQASLFADRYGGVLVKTKMNEVKVEQELLSSVL